jgi:hypothetical protein
MVKDDVWLTGGATCVALMLDHVLHAPITFYFFNNILYLLKYQNDLQLT